MDHNVWDFSGWATVIDRKCSDGRTIRKGAFRDNDGKIVPLVWNHQHNEPANVLGHAMLKDYPEGTYAFGKFNDTESGRNAKMLVDSGDINSLSIYAAQLKQNGGDVLHGDIKEVSLVLAGANPGAFIDQILSHSDGDNDESAIIYTGEELIHGEIFEEDEFDDEDEDDEDILEHADDEEDEEDGDDEDENRTIADVIDTMNADQKKAMTALLAQLIDKYEGKSKSADKEETNKEGEKTMKHNVFESAENSQNVLSHSDQAAIIKDVKRYGSLKDSILAHTQEYGIEDIDVLFPEDRFVSNEPAMLKRDDDWVSKVMNAVHHTPFSRIKSMYADITGDAARAKGYIKGTQKVEEVFPLFKRSTPPTTVYKKQKLDRDDLLDITDFDTVAWLKKEMRAMLNEELARAFLVGDGRTAGIDDDKIDESCIRPIYNDTTQEVYAFYVDVANVMDGDELVAGDTAKAIIKAVIRNRKNYKGTGMPTFYCTEDCLTEMLLLEDLNGRIIYDSVDKLATALRVKEIVTVPVMEGITREDDDNVEYTLQGIIVNLADYNVGADKGGQVSMFDDFDIDYNQQKYLIETRCSGALVVPKSAMIIETYTETE